MICGALLKKEWKSNWKLFLIFAGILSLYILIIIGMYDPEMGEGLLLMQESMPELFAAFGMAAPGVTLLDFLLNYLYGFLLTVFPFLYLVLLIQRMLVRYMDEGSLAYLLATPNSRRALILTQGLGGLLQLLGLLVYVSLLEIAGCEIFFPGELEVGTLLAVNLGLFGLWIFLFGLMFFFACLFGEGRLIFGWGVGLPVAFLLLQMLSQVGERLGKLKYVTPFTLFDAGQIADGEGKGMAMALVLYGMGVLLSAAGIVLFEKKDFSL